MANSFRSSLTSDGGIARHVSNFENTSFTERTQLALPVHIDFFAIYISLNKYAHTPDIIAEYVSQKKRDAISSIDTSTAISIIGSGAIRAKFGLKGISNLQNICLPFMRFKDVASTQSQRSLLMELTNLTGFSAGLVCLSPSDPTLFIHFFGSKLGSDKTAMFSNWGEEKISCADNPIIASLPDPDSSHFISKTVTGVPIGWFLPHSSRPNDEEKSKTFPQLAIGHASRLALPGNLLNQLQDFVKVYCAIVLNTEYDYSYAQLAVTRATILKPIMEMVIHNHMILRAVGLPVFANDEAILNFFDLWIHVRNAKTGNLTIVRTTEGRSNASVDLEMLHTSLFTVLTCSSGRELAILQSRIYHAISISRDTHLVSEFFAQWDLLLGHKRNGFIESFLSKYKLLEGEEISKAYHAWLYSPTSLEIMAAVLNEVKRVALGNVDHKISSNSISKVIEDGLKDAANWTIVSSSGRKFLLPGWILVARWPYFLDLARSGTKEVKSMTATFSEISDEIMVLIVRFICRCQPERISPLYDASEMTILKSFLIYEGCWDRYKLEEMRMLLFPHWKKPEDSATTDSNEMDSTIATKSDTASSSTSHTSSVSASSSSTAQVAAAPTNQAGAPGNHSHKDLGFFSGWT